MCVVGATVLRYRAYEHACMCAAALTSRQINHKLGSDAQTCSRGSFIDVSAPALRRCSRDRDRYARRSAIVRERSRDARRDIRARFRENARRRAPYPRDEVSRERSSGNRRGPVGRSGVIAFRTSGRTFTHRGRIKSPRVSPLR